MTTPLFTGVNHTGINVSDLAAAVAFFTDNLGFVAEPLHGTLGGGDPEQISRWFGVLPGTHLYYAFLRAADGSRVELLQWVTPEQTPVAASSTAVHAGHLALSVPDLAAATQALAQVPGTRVLEQFSDRFAFVATPWGFWLQLSQVAG